MAHAAEDLDISAIAVFTETGTTARQLSKYRPKSPIFGLSSVERVIHRMTLLWGVHPLLCNKLATAEQMVETAERLLEEGGHVQPRQILGIVAGTRTKSGSTNFLRLHVLGDTLSETGRGARRGAGASSRQAAGQDQTAGPGTAPAGAHRPLELETPSMFRGTGTVCTREAAFSELPHGSNRAVRGPRVPTLRQSAHESAMAAVSLLV